MTIFGPHILK